MINLIPKPKHIEKHKGTALFSNYQIIIENKYEKAVLLFNEELSNKLNVNEEKELYTFEFIINRKLKEEEYILYVSQDMTHVEACSEKGFFYATRTLKQLLNLYTDKKVDSLKLPYVYIEDLPRYQYRCFMLDEVRHFFGIDEVKKYLDILSDLKINYFHWHLSDDQGFRIDFATFPKLKEIASKRSNTEINFIGSEQYDNHEYQRIYSYHEIKEIIKYAQERNISIIPEIDIPGHTTALIAAYPFLHCQSKQIEVASKFGIFDSSICLGKQSSFDFVKKLLDEICLLFKDSKYIHIGGDEVLHNNYNNCEDCLKKQKELNLNNMSELQSYFSNEIAKYILDVKHKKVIMWNDGIYETMDERILVQYWNVYMGEVRNKVMNQERKIINSKVDCYYFCDPYSSVGLKATYGDVLHIEGVERKNYKNIIGKTCCVWSEWIENNKKLEFNTNPRLFAFAESCWTAPINKNYEDFLIRIEKFKAFYKHYNLYHADKNIYLANKKTKTKLLQEYETNKYAEVNHK